MLMDSVCWTARPMAWSLTSEGASWVQMHHVRWSSSWS